MDENRMETKDLSKEVLAGERRVFTMSALELPPGCLLIVHSESLEPEWLRLLAEALHGIVKTPFVILPQEVNVSMVPRETLKQILGEGAERKEGEDAPL